MVHEAGRGEHLEYMRQLNQHLADGTCFWHVLSGNLGQEPHRELTTSSNDNEETLFKI